LDVAEFEEHLPRLIEILKYLFHNEVIIHPISKIEPIDMDSIIKLCDKVTYASRELDK